MSSLRKRLRKNPERQAVYEYDLRDDYREYKEAYKKLQEENRK